MRAIRALFLLAIGAVHQSTAMVRTALLCFEYGVLSTDSSHAPKSPEAFELKPTPPCREGVVVPPGEMCLQKCLVTETACYRQMGTIGGLGIVVAGCAEQKDGRDICDTASRNAMPLAAPHAPIAALPPGRTGAHPAGPQRVGFGGALRDVHRKQVQSRGEGLASLCSCRHLLRAAHP